MTVLVTGGCGYIGAHVVHALHQAGEKVVVVDDLDQHGAFPPPCQARGAMAATVSSAASTMEAKAASMPARGSSLKKT